MTQITTGPDGQPRFDGMDMELIVSLLTGIMAQTPPRGTGHE